MNNLTNEDLIEFAIENCDIFPEDSNMGKYLRETIKFLEENTNKLSNKEKEINAQVVATGAKLHEIMKNIESRKLYKELSCLDRQIYKIRTIVKGESI